MVFETLCNRVGEDVAVHRKRAAGRQPRPVAASHDERTATAHLLVQEADGVGLVVVRAEGVGADELRKPVGLVSVGLPRRPHLVQHDWNTRPRDLPGCLASRESTADHMNRV